MISRSFKRTNGTLLGIALIMIAQMTSSCEKSNLCNHTIPMASHHIPIEVPISSLEDFLHSIRSSTKSTEPQGYVIDTLKKQALQTKAADGIIPEDCTNLIYIVNFGENSGYALLAADDRIPDLIIAVRQKGSMSASHLSDLYNKYFGCTLDSRAGIYEDDEFELYDSEAEDWYIGNYTGGSGDPTQITSDYINALTVHYVVGELNDDPHTLPEMPSIGEPGEITTVISYADGGTTTVVNNMLGDFSYWSQVLSPFNDYTPSHYPAGCVNIALGKIVSYFSGPFSLTVNGNTINWYDIKHNPNSTSGILSLGLLMYYLGFACDSWYLPFGVGTFTLPSKAATFLSNMGYNNVQYADYSTTTVKASLENGCPVFVSAINCFGGFVPDLTKSHAWNIDGYKNKYTIRTIKYYRNGILINTQTTTQTTTLVHCAFGWSGTDDDYFASGVFNFYSNAIHANVNYKVYLKTITYNNPLI